MCVRMYIALDTNFPAFELKLFKNLFSRPNEYGAGVEYERSISRPKTLMQT